MKNLRNMFHEIGHSLTSLYFISEREEKVRKEVFSTIDLVEEKYEKGEYIGPSGALADLKAQFTSMKSSGKNLVLDEALKSIDRVEKTYAEAIAAANRIKAEKVLFPPNDWHSVFTGDLPMKDWGNDDGYYYCKATVYDALHNRYCVADARYDCRYNHWAELRMGYDGSHTGERYYCEIPDNSTSRMIVAWMPIPKIRVYEPTMEEKRIIGALEWEKEDCER